jgi:hypothetical protein
MIMIFMVNFWKKKKLKIWIDGGEPVVVSEHGGERKMMKVVLEREKYNMERL